MVLSIIAMVDNLYYKILHIKIGQLKCTKKIMNLFLLHYRMQIFVYVMANLLRQEQVQGMFFTENRKILVSFNFQTVCIHTYLFPLPSKVENSFPELISVLFSVHYTI